MEKIQMPPQIRRTSFVSSLSLPLATAGIAVWLGAGCLGHAPTFPSASSLREPPDDGLPDSKMVFLGMTPEKWEEAARADCERDPAGKGCSKLFERAADRIRWGVNSDDAQGLLVHACEQGHRPSCAALDLFRSPSLDNAGAFAWSGCPRPFQSNLCYATASLLSHACNDRKQVAGCLALAYLFARSEPPDVVWMNHYKDLACLHGGFCNFERPASSSQHAEAAE